MNIRKFALAIVITMSGLSANGQDAHFSQYYASGLYLNPAIVGMEPGLMFGSNYRTQWRSIVMPYVTSQVSLIVPFFSQKNKEDVHIGGAGISLYNDRAGDGNFKTLGLNINGAYNLHISANHTLTFGVQGGFIQKSIDFTNLQWGEQFNPYIGFDATVNPSETTINSKKLYPDISTGLMYYFRASQAERTVSVYVGGSAFHINRPNESLVNNAVSKLPILYKGHLGFEIPVGEKLSFSPNGLMMMQNNVMYLNTGLYCTYTMNDGGKVLLPSDVILGAWYRLKDSFIFSIGTVNNNYLIGFSYDFNSSSLRYNTRGRGAYEISLSIRKPREKTIMRFHTPRI
ncbi:MAG: type IX secretion system membrane protein PorP/SprF [Cytophagaceae bacterium]|nr:type IX secretion system membrane protein PorP/SprF [Cytophagaceae bacterium]